MLTPSMQRNNSKLAVRDAYFVHFSSRLNAYSEADSSGSPDFLVLKLSFCPGGSAKHAPGIGLVGALTNRAVNRENKEVASQQHVGLWRSLGARFHGMEEVVGSIPTRSTNQSNNLNRATGHRRDFCANPPAGDAAVPAMTLPPTSLRYGNAS